MSHNRFRSFLSAFLYQPAVAALIVFMLLAGNVGCSGEPGGSDLIEVMQQQPPHHLNATDRQVEILEIEPNGDDQWKILLQCQETPAEDWLLKLNPKETLQGDATAAANFESTLETLNHLRAPENEGLDKLKREIERFTFPDLFQQVAPQGAPVTWTATAVWDQSGEQPKLTFSDLKLADGKPVVDLIAKPDMPQDAALVDGGPLDPVRKYAELREKLISGVAQASQEMEQRLKTEQQALLSLLQQPMAFAGTLSPAQTESENVNFYFEQAATPETVSGVAIQSDDPLSRVVFSGTLTLPPVNTNKAIAYRRVHDGWLLALKNEDSRLSPLARKVRDNRYVYYDKQKNLFQWSDGRVATSLEPAAASSSAKPMSLKELAQTVIEGAQYKGTESITGQADRAIKMAITRFEPETGNLCVVLEDAQTPFTFAVFEGKLQREAPHHLGIPVRLSQVAYKYDRNQKSVKHGIFSYKSGADLLLIPTEKGFQGRFAQADLNLEKVTQESEVIPAEQRWRNALVPGYAWRGVTKWRNEAVRPATLRVAEVRDQGKYVRLTLERDDDPVQEVVYEGSLVSEDGRIDGYGLVTQQFGAAAKYEHEYFGVFFSRWESEDKKVFRISPDGKTIYGLTTDGETLILERDPAIEKTEEMTTEERKAIWKKVLTPGTIWEGTIKNVKQKQTAELKMIVRGYELDGKQVTLEFTPKVKRNAKTIFEGSLNNNDKGTNGFGLILKKTLKFAGPGNVFGSGDTKLEFRLDATGKRLLGRTNDYGDVEYLDLHLLEKK